MFVNVRDPRSHCGPQTIFAAKQFSEFKSTPFEKRIVWPFGGSEIIFGVHNPISGFNLAPIVAKVFHLQPPRGHERGHKQFLPPNNFQSSNRPLLKKDLFADLGGANQLLGSEIPFRAANNFRRQTIFRVQMDPF